ncbi:hypothetical protein [Amycolatopsis nigrescens]|uniref:hypothetical protein n=1 Tax=Amycolatopsis nigrescens TaxID=381445 RepID=UPI000379314A|nr:hypothetical protein [Amycolatopsis nigrescens]
MSEAEHADDYEPLDARLNGENFMQAMGDLFQGAQSSEKGAKPDQVLTLGMGKLQALGLMAIYYEIRHGNDQQAKQTAALRRLTEELHAQNEIARAREGK